MKVSYRKYKYIGNTNKMHTHLYIDIYIHTEEVGERSFRTKKMVPSDVAEMGVITVGMCCMFGGQFRDVTALSH